MFRRKQRQDAGAHSSKELRCSFCNKTQDEVLKLIAGPSVFICNECVQVCSEIIADDNRLCLRVGSIECAAGVLRVRCKGTIGIGTESVASMEPLSEALEVWMRENPDHAVREIIVDFRDVDYRWGDAPISCLLPFLVTGVQRVHYVASASSAPALEDLLRTAAMPGFSVERADA
jgi:hypothetical protein